MTSRSVVEPDFPPAQLGSGPRAGPQAGQGQQSIVFTTAGLPPLGNGFSTADFGLRQRPHEATA